MMNILQHLFLSVALAQFEEWSFVQDQFDSAEYKLFDIDKGASDQLYKALAFVESKCEHIDTLSCYIHDAFYSETGRCDRECHNDPVPQDYHCFVQQEFAQQKAQCNHAMFVFKTLVDARRAVLDQACKEASDSVAESDTSKPLSQHTCEFGHKMVDEHILFVRQFIPRTMRDAE